MGRRFFLCSVVGVDMMKPEVKRFAEEMRMQC